MSELVTNAEPDKEPVVGETEGEEMDTGDKADDVEVQEPDVQEPDVQEKRPEDDGFDADSSDDDGDGDGEKGPEAEGGEEKKVEEEEGDDMEEDDGEGKEEAAQPMHAQTPDSLQGMRACKRCGLIKTFQQFYDIGCENCPFLEMEEDQTRVTDCTSGYYGGITSIIDPNESWMAKWLGLRKALPGCYAMTITGTFPPEIEHVLTERGEKWRCKEDP
ncbi:hypothetical protein TrVE_jg1841 [Triparma verrucosa]|uniref:Spt4/RpoE2 zinc finger domain-containing protein n=2 Tax=Triparma TaxID=722752 RepID=A0A9W7AXX4_9STRA|nr:hypothetical protein TrST_g14217 [Triparma strigata]GMI00323.1 hypothetical protein TrVE_jg1841 [Triparma verrucosa]